MFVVGLLVLLFCYVNFVCEYVNNCEYVNFSYEVHEYSFINISSDIAHLS